MSTTWFIVAMFVSAFGDSWLQGQAKQVRIFVYLCTSIGFVVAALSMHRF